MSRATWAVIFLAVALVGSNLWWAYQALDQGISYTYLEASYLANKEALAQALEILPVVARPGVSRQAIVEAAARVATDDSGFEKDGLLWIGGLGLRFDAEGRLVEVERAWSPP